MLKHIKLGVFALGFAALTIGCANDSEVRDDAANAAVNTENTAVTPPPATEVTPGEEVAAPTGPTTTIAFAETEFDFGSVDQGEKVSHVYKFTNTGSEPLIISSAKGSCGCTVPKWPKDPIAPGQSGEIQVEFDSKGKKNQQNKKVTITANTNPPQSFIYLKGEVIAPEGAETPATNISVQ